ncbi:MAG TPA: hypothetical protein VG206_26800 [Terriglobia bacterium]|nr:hypothetical protein [Terriglobia bacterium]
MIEVRGWVVLPICVAALVAAWRLQSRVSDFVTDAKHLAERVDAHPKEELPGWPQRIEKEGQSAKVLALALVIITAFLSLAFLMSVLPGSYGDGPTF